MPISLTNLIARVPEEVESRVKRVRNRARAALQEALRTECRLTMKASSEAEDDRQGALVPVEVQPGHPAILNDVRFPDDFDLVQERGQADYAFSCILSFWIKTLAM